MTVTRLVCVNINDSAPVIPLQRLPMTLGRGTEADVQIADQCASRLHCRIVEVENQLLVQDLGSTLGTLVNGQPIEEAPLNPGDRLTIGISTFCVDRGISVSASLLSRIRASIKKLRTPPREHSPKVDSAAKPHVTRSVSEGGCSKTL